MANQLSPEREKALREIARSEAKVTMDVVYQLFKLEAEKQVFYEHLVETREFLREELKKATGRDTLDGWIMCGSGLASLPDAEGVEIIHRIPIEQIPHWFVPQAPGHGKEVIFANMGGQLVGIVTGRAHIYDTDYSPEQLKMITAPLVVAKGMGAEWLVTTNAAGANDNRNLEIGDMVIDVDYVNNQGVNPLYGPNDERLGQRFPSKANTADSHLAARLAKILPADRLHLGVYTLANNSPLYEGSADLVNGSYAKLLEQNPKLVELFGMSFALEAIVMQHFNNPPQDENGFDRPLRWIGLTAVTNKIPPVKAPTMEALIARTLENPNPTSHDEVLEGAVVAEALFIPAIVELAKSISAEKLPAVSVG